MQLSSLLLGGLLLLASGLVQAAEPPVITLGAISSEASDQVSIINIRLSAKPAWTKVPIEYHGSFVQLPLAGTVAPEPGVFHDASGPHFTKIGVFQATPTKTIVRLFTPLAEEQLTQALEAELLGNRIMVTVDHGALKAAGAKTATATAAASAEPPQTPASPLSAVGASNPFASFDMKDYLVKIAMVLALILLLALGGLTYRRIARGRAYLAAKGASRKMQQVDQLSLTAKQGLSLVQVDGRRLLLSVSPENVQLLSDLSNPPGRSGGVTLVPAPTAPPPPPMAAAPIPAAATTPRLSQPAAPRPEPANPAAATPAPAAAKPDPGRSKAIDDVTHLIREKIKNLPRV